MSYYLCCLVVRNNPLIHYLSPSALRQSSVDPLRGCSGIVEILMPYWRREIMPNNPNLSRRDSRYDIQILKNDSPSYRYMDSDVKPPERS